MSSFCFHYVSLLKSLDLKLNDFVLFNQEMFINDEAWVNRYFPIIQKFLLCSFCRKTTINIGFYIPFNCQNIQFLCKLHRLNNHR